MRKTTVIIILFLFINEVYCQHDAVGISAQNKFKEDRGFWQDYHEAQPVGNSLNENNIRSIAVDKKKTVWIATEAGIFFKKHGENKWSPVVFQDSDTGPAFAVAIDEHDAVWMGTWNGAFEYENDLAKKIAGTQGPISVICFAMKVFMRWGQKVFGYLITIIS